MLERSLFGIGSNRSMGDDIHIELHYTKLHVTFRVMF